MWDRLRAAIVRDYWDTASLAALVIAFIVISATFRSYGYSWDEAAYNVLYGKLVLKFLSTFGSDRGALTTYNLYLYGGAYDAAREFVVGLLSFNPKYVRHFLNASTGLVCMTGAWLAARLIFGSRAGFLALIFLSVTPAFWGHIFINAKDIPFAAGYVWSIYWILRFDRELPRPKIHTTIFLSVTIGLTIGVRIGGVLLFFYLALIAFHHVVYSKRGNIFGLIVNVIIICASAWLVMMIFWPAAMLSPLSAPYEAFVAASRFNWHDSVLFNGNRIISGDLPWTYLPVMFGVALPEVVLMAVIGGICYSVWKAGERILAGERKDAAGVILFLIAGLFPPIWAIVVKAKLYDNMRHFLFILPILCCMAGGAVSAGISALGKRANKVCMAACALLAVGLLVPVRLMAALHPYEYVYINTLGGGMPDGENNFETEYWLTSYSEALQLTKAHADNVTNVANVPLAKRKYTLVALGNDDVIFDELPWYFELLPAQLSIPPDYVIVTSRWEEEWVLPDYPLIGTVGRLGMTFAKVYASPVIVEMGNGRIRFNER